MAVEPSRPQAALWLCVHPDDVAELLRQPELRRGPIKGQRQSSVWYDTQDQQLASAGLSLALCHEGGPPIWRLERLVADSRWAWPPGGLPPPLGAAEKIADLPLDDASSLEARLMPVVACECQLRQLPTVDPDLTATLQEGTLRAVVDLQPICRLLLQGPASGRVALALSSRLRVSVAAHSLAAAAIRLAGRKVATRPLGAPLLDNTLDVDSGFAFVVAHLAGVIAHHGAFVRAPDGPEPVHQMRVAVRRLRSALKLFRKAAACPELDDLDGRLKALAQVLGPARDWDVFTLGVGRKLSTAFADETAVTQLLTAAAHRRRTAYFELNIYLDSADYRSLGVAVSLLALTRPWLEHPPQTPEDVERRDTIQHASLPHYAARALDRRLAEVIAPGSDLSGLEPAQLHAIRLHAKRLRYAAEFFSPLFSGSETRRFLRRLSALQERLGHLNDGTVAAELMARLPQTGRPRALAIGIVRGFVAASSAGGRRKMERTWHRFLKLEPFWH